WGAAELDLDLRQSRPHPLAGAQEERHALPTPGVDLELERGKRRRARVAGNTVLLTIAGHLFPLIPAAPVLAEHEIALLERTHLREHLHLLLPDGVGAHHRRHLHGDER